MGNFEFFTLVLDDMWIYFASLFFTISLILLNKRVRKSSLLDPIFYNSIYFSFALSVPLFLYLTDNIDLIYLIVFYFSSALGYCIFINTPRIRMERFTSILQFDRYIINLSLCIYVSLTLLSYVKFGIPLLSGDKLGSFVASGGYGVIPRINSGLYLIILFGTIGKIMNDYRMRKKIKFFNISPLLLVIIFGIFSGSRAWIFNISISVFLYFVLFESKVVRLSILNLTFVIFIVFLSFGIGSGEFGLSSAYLFGYRVALNGDAYFMALPNQVINSLKADAPFLHLFSVILAPLRIIDVNDSILPFGVMLARYHYPSLDSFVGPNSTPAVYGFYLFGYFGVIFTFVNFLLAGFICFRVAPRTKRTFVGAVYSAKLYLMGVSFISDSSFALSALFDLILLFFYILFLRYVIYIFIFCKSRGNIHS